MADNGNEPRKGEGMCTREKDRKHSGKKRERVGKRRESGEVGERGTRRENRNKNRSERTRR